MTTTTAHRVRPTSYRIGKVTVLKQRLGPKREAKPRFKTEEEREDHILRKTDSENRFEKKPRYVSSIYSWGAR